MTSYFCLKTEYHLKSLALALNARSVAGWSLAEETLAKKTAAFSEKDAAYFKKRIQKGEDPLGSALCHLRSPEQRRGQGATYTPRDLSRAMVKWAFDQKLNPTRIVDPGVGSAEFLRMAAKKF